MKNSILQKSSDCTLQSLLNAHLYHIKELEEVFVKSYITDKKTLQLLDKQKQIYLKKIAQIKQEQQRRKVLLETLLANIQDPTKIDNISLSELNFGANGKKALTLLQKNNITTLGQVIKIFEEQGDKGFLNIPGFYKQKLHYLKQVLKEYKVNIPTIKDY